MLYGETSAKMHVNQREWHCPDCIELVSTRRAVKRARLEAAEAAVVAATVFVADHGGASGSGVAEHTKAAPAAAADENAADHEQAPEYIAVNTPAK